MRPNTPSVSRTSRRLRDGWTFFSATHYDSASTFWTASTSFRRTPKVLVSGLTDFVASTAASHPYDELTNPTGVQDPKLVRVSLGTTQRLQEKGKITWPYRVDRITLRPRN